jgi:tRNA modification GTPase
MSESPDYTRDTIVASATPPGKGGVGIVRISGPAAETIAKQMLDGLPEPRYAANRTFADKDGVPLDSGIAIWFPAPGSFTGESVLELHGHGGPVVMSLLIDAAIALGARRAEAGEFSRRAFLNGKLDLSQAEAIADLIDAGTSQAARAALRSLSGAFSNAVDALVEKLIGLRLHVEAAIDFPEEEIDFLADEALSKRLEDCRTTFDELLTDAAAGRVLRDGFRVVIIGKPNAGKSSLLNLLSGQDAAIVTEVAGTTRDIIREQIDIDGLAVELIDTAGIRDNPDSIEAEGIRRARKAMSESDAVLWIQDVGRPDEETLDEVLPADVPVIVLRNKIDISGDLPGLNQQNPLVLNMSAKTGEGIDALKNAITRTAGYLDMGEGAFTARRRHISALQVAREHFDIGRAALLETQAGEILAEELRLAQASLSAITGEFSSDDLLGRIFSEFCIGK